MNRFFNNAHCCPLTNPIHLAHKISGIINSGLYEEITYLLREAYEWSSDSLTMSVLCWLKSPYYVLKWGSHKEILLLQSQLLTAEKLSTKYNKSQHLDENLNQLLDTAQTVSQGCAWWLTKTHWLWVETHYRKIRVQIPVPSVISDLVVGCSLSFFLARSLLNKNTARPLNVCTSHTLYAV